MKNLNWTDIVRWGCILTTVFALGTLVGCNKPAAGATPTATATVVAGEFSVNERGDVQVAQDEARICAEILSMINTIDDGPEWPSPETK